MKRIFPTSPTSPPLLPALAALLLMVAAPAEAAPPAPSGARMPPPVHMGMGRPMGLAPLRLGESVDPLAPGDPGGDPEGDPGGDPGGPDVTAGGGEEDEDKDKDGIVDETGEPTAAGGADHGAGEAGGVGAFGEAGGGMGAGHDVAGDGHGGGEFGHDDHGGGGSEHGGGEGGGAGKGAPARGVNVQVIPGLLSRATVIGETEAGGPYSTLGNSALW